MTREPEDHWADWLALVLAVPLVIFLFGLAMYFIGPHR